MPGSLRNDYCHALRPPLRSKNSIDGAAFYDSMGNVITPMLSNSSLVHQDRSYLAARKIPIKNFELEVIFVDPGNSAKLN